MGLSRGRSPRGGVGRASDSRDLSTARRVANRATEALQSAIENFTFSTGDFKVSGATVAAAGWLLCDGTAESRTGESALFNALTFTKEGTTANGSNTITLGSPYTRAHLGVGMNVEGRGIPASTTITGTPTGTTITLSSPAGTGAGAGTLRFFPYGSGNGSTTFNRPNFVDRSVVGGGPSVVNRSLGQTGGAAEVTLGKAHVPAHSHLVRAGQLDNTTATGGANRLYAFLDIGQTAPVGSAVSTNTSEWGDGGPHENMPPFGVGYWYVKR